MKIYVLLLLTSLSVTTAYGSGYESAQAPLSIRKAHEFFDLAASVITTDPETTRAEKLADSKQLQSIIYSENTHNINIQHDLMKRARALEATLSSTKTVATSARRLELK